MLYSVYVYPVMTSNLSLLYLCKSTSRRLLALSWLLAMFIEYKRHKGTMSRESYFVFFQSELFTVVYLICLKEITTFIKYLIG